MKRLITSVFIFCGLILCSSLSAFAQDEIDEPNPIFQEGDIVINAGFGLGTTYSWSSGSLGLPVGAGIEYGITNLETGSIGVGGDFGIVSGDNLTITYLGLKGAYHLSEVLEIDNDKLDIYAGLGLYYRDFNYSGGSSFNTGIYAGYHAGARYYVSENIGVYAEIGNNWGWLNIGGVFAL